MLLLAAQQTLLYCDAVQVIRPPSHHFLAFRRIRRVVVTTYSLALAPTRGSISANDAPNASTRFNPVTVYEGDLATIRLK